MLVDPQKMAAIEREFAREVMRQPGLAKAITRSQRPMIFVLETVAAARVRTRNGNEGEIAAMIDSLKSEH